jgi:Flp pilus assembly pilin Flp
MARPDGLRRYFQFAIEFARDDSAQDLVEYALLAAFIGISGYVALSAIAPALASTYSTWLDPSTGVPSLWDPPAPLASGS